MSNTNSPFGFRPLGLTEGVSPTFALRTAEIAHGNTTPIYRGDPVIRNTSGYIEQWSSAVAPGLVVGIFWGAKYLSTALARTVSNTFWPGNDAAYDATAYVIPCSGSVPGLFMAQAGAAAVTLSNVGQCVSPVIGTGSIKGTQGVSGAYLGTPTATTALEFKIAGLASDVLPYGTPGTDDTAAYNLVLVQFNAFAEAGTA
jgi:hypothetical protein